MILDQHARSPVTQIAQPRYARGSLKYSEILDVGRICHCRMNEELHEQQVCAGCLTHDSTVHHTQNMFLI